MNCGIELVSKLIWEAKVMKHGIESDAIIRALRAAN